MAYPHMNIDGDSSEDDDIGPILGGHPVNLGNILLHIAGRARGATNDEMVRQMRDNGTIHKDKVFRAMSVCPRGLFVPSRHKGDSYMDMPIRVDQYGFNISAPHMHATALETLDIKPGDRVLDVGCGCGVWTAYAAYMAGPSGEVVGVDIRDACIKMCNESDSSLRDTNSDYATKACPITFELHNIFMPAMRHRGRYNKVHVGATCPDSRLPQLLALLAPEGGSIMAPVGSDLRLVTRSADGRITHKILSQVRFQDLEVPTDAQVVLATLEADLQEQALVKVPPGTLEQDMAAAGLQGASSSPWASRRSMDSSGTGAEAPAGPEESDDTDMAEAATPPHPSKITSKDQADTSTKDQSSPRSPAAAAAAALALGPPDASLAGSGWRIAVHRQLMCARCELLRAKWCSGWKDSEDGEVQVPDAFSKAAVQAMVDYAYSDELDESLSASEVLEVLQVAAYYGAGRLLVLCEAALAAELAAVSEDEEEGAELAPALLAVADELGLQQLRAVAQAYCVGHFDKVCGSKAWGQLSAGQVGLVAREAVGQLGKVKRLLGEISDRCNEALPPPRWL